MGFYFLGHYCKKHFINKESQVIISFILLNVLQTYCNVER